MCAHARVHRDPERRVHTYTPRSSCDSVCAAVDDRDAWKRTGGARHTDINIPSWNVINHRRIRRSSPAASSSPLSCYPARSPHRGPTPLTQPLDFEDSVWVTRSSNNQIVRGTTIILIGSTTWPRRRERPPSCVWEKLGGIIRCWRKRVFRHSDETVDDGLFQFA